MLPGSDLPSMAPLLRKGETHPTRSQRMVDEDFEFDASPEAPSSETTSAMLCSAGMQKLREGKGADAKQLFAKAVLADPVNPEALFSMGLYYEVAHQPAWMVRWMDAAIEAQPNHVLAWVLRSKYLEHQGRLEEALRGYEHAAHLRPNDQVARSKLTSILNHQRVHILPCDAWEEGAAEEISACGSESSADLPEWQENFLQPAAARTLRQPLLQTGVMAWDNVLSTELLAQLDDCVDHYQQFTFTNGWVYTGDDKEGSSGGAAATVWLPSETCPATAPELAARYLLQRILQEDSGEFAGVEYWGRVRSVNLGAGLHYDEAVDSLDANNDWVHGNPWRPQWSSVLYLSDEGGPTVILDQLHCQDGRNVPEIPQRGHLCMPRRNRLVVFRADLFHGTLPVNVWLNTTEKRRVFIFNFWRSHRPEEPHCQRQDYGRHVAMQGLQLRPEDLHRLQAAEAEPRAAPSPVQRRTFWRPEELPHSSDCGFLPIPMPMPSMAQLKEGTGFCELDWRVAAAEASS